MKKVDRFHNPPNGVYMWPSSGKIFVLTKKATYPLENGSGAHISMYCMITDNGEHPKTAIPDYVNFDAIKIGEF